MSLIVTHGVHHTVSHKIPDLAVFSMHFAVDGNGDEVVSLYTPADAIWSTANYLAQSGWHNELPENKQREVIWKYNRSQAYISTVLDIARILRSRLD